MWLRICQLQILGGAEDASSIVSIPIDWHAHNVTSSQKSTAASNFNRIWHSSHLPTPGYINSRSVAAPPIGYWNHMALWRARFRFCLCPSSVSSHSHHRSCRYLRGSMSYTDRHPQTELSEYLGQVVLIFDGVPCQSDRTWKN